jgi:hypothetical protein
MTETWICTNPHCRCEVLVSEFKPPCCDRCGARAQPPEDDRPLNLLEIERRMDRSAGR